MRLGGALVAVISLSLGTAVAEDNVPAASEQELVPVLEQHAADFVRLRGDLEYADVTPLDAAQVTRNVHNRLHAHTPEDVSMGQMAYAALIAADTPAFADAIERRASKPKKREQFLEDLRANPAMVRELDGVDDAIAAIRANAVSDATRIGRTGERYIADAYRLQEAGWARRKLPANGSARLGQAKAFETDREWPAQSPLPAIISEAGNRRPNLTATPAWSGAWSSQNGTAPVALDTSRQIYLTKVLVLAARYSLNDLNEGHMDAFATDKRNGRCYKMAKLNFAQCISASRTSYEEAFCIGTHGLNDVSRCVGWIAGAGSPQG